MHGPDRVCAGAFPAASHAIAANIAAISSFFIIIKFVFLKINISEFTTEISRSAQFHPRGPGNC